MPLLATRPRLCATAPGIVEGSLNTMIPQRMESTSAHEETYLTTKELAALLKRSLDTLKDWRTKGTGPAYIKAGRAILYPLTAVNTWLSEREAVNTAQVEARLRRERLQRFKPGDEDYALNTLLAALATLPANIEGVEAWRRVQYMEVEHTENGDVRVKDMVMRDQPVTDTDLKRLEGLTNS